MITGFIIGFVLLFGLFWIADGVEFERDPNTAAIIVLAIIVGAIGAGIGHGMGLP